MITITLRSQLEPTKYIVHPLMLEKIKHLVDILGHYYVRVTKHFAKCHAKHAPTGAAKGAFVQEVSATVWQVILEKIVVLAHVWTISTMTVLTNCVRVFVHQAKWPILLIDSANHVSTAPNAQDNPQYVQLVLEAFKNNIKTCVTIHALQGLMP